jgi:Glycosyltransferase
MDKLKVLQVIPNFGVGGAEKVVLDYLTFMNRDRVEIRAISMYKKSGSIYDQSIEQQGLDVIYLDKKPGFDLSMIPKIKYEIDKYQPDIIHSHLYTMKYLLPSLISYRKARLFHTIHNTPEKDARGIDKFCNWLAFRYLDCIPIALSNDMVSKINNYYNINSSMVVNNAVDLSKFKDVKNGNSNIRKQLGLSNDCFVIGHVGRFSHQKNHDFIVDVFNCIEQVEKKAVLFLIGDGELMNVIRKKVQMLGLEEKVYFLGIRDDIPELLADMDVFVFPSIYEGFPISLIEAQASGLWCVISENIDKTAILSNRTVSLSLNDSIETWRDTILHYMNAKKNDVVYLSDDYDIHNVVGKLERIYRANFTTNGGGLR